MRAQKTIVSAAKKLPVIAGILVAHGFSASTTQAYEDTGPGFYWVCNASTGEYTCGNSSPYGNCWYRDGSGNEGWIGVGESLKNFPYNCNDYMKTGPYTDESVSM